MTEEGDLGLTGGPQTYWLKGSSQLKCHMWVLLCSSSMLSVASHSGTLLVLAMAIRSDFHETFRRIARLFYWFPKSLTCSKNRKSKLLWSQGGEGKYICHAHCRDLVHLDYPQNGNVSSCMPTSEVRYSIKKNSQDVEKEKETHSYLSKEEIKEKVHKYNLAVTDKLKMTLSTPASSQTGNIHSTCVW
ncbi:ras association domain-containing protein 3 isoform X4 [Homo sapiens]|uniref:ras association domain-containing protein 3 isoform X4 n=1 Tax=Homo sapiens TaxID=9606 RepID=UPI001FB05EA6|nr:ras association domain-containing protein 3 isoform X4 [Homo sapiens]XP_054227752.1 ras association domain-containing protein 3 isoform X4 [Homo sapiens]